MNVREVIDKYDAIYQKKETPFGEKDEFLSMILNLVSLNQKTKLLEIGCGNGNLLKQLERKSKFIIGMEISHRALMNVKNRGLIKPLLLQADCLKLPFRDNVFDIIFCLGVLEHVYSIEQGIGEISRVLKRGGRAIIILPNRYWFRKFLAEKYPNNKYILILKVLLSMGKGFFFNIARKKISEFDWKTGKQPIENEYDLTEVKKLLSKNFRILKTLPTGFIGDDWRIRKLNSIFNPLITCFEFLIVMENR